MSAYRDNDLIRRVVEIEEQLTAIRKDLRARPRFTSVNSRLALCALVSWGVLALWTAVRLSHLPESAKTDVCTAVTFVGGATAIAVGVWAIAPTFPR